MPKDKNICPTCNKPTGEAGHMCVPVEQHDSTCDWCGSMIVNPRHVCHDKVKELTYICNSCGRTAIQAEHLCQPEKIN